MKKICDFLKQSLAKHTPKKRRETERTHAQNKIRRRALRRLLPNTELRVYPQELHQIVIDLLQHQRRRLRALRVQVVALAGLHFRDERRVSLQQLLRLRHFVLVVRVRDALNDVTRLL